MKKEEKSKMYKKMLKVVLSKAREFFSNKELMEVTRKLKEKEESEKENEEDEEKAIL